MWDPSIKTEHAHFLHTLFLHRLENIWCEFVNPISRLQVCMSGPSSSINRGRSYSFQTTSCGTAQRRRLTIEKSLCAGRSLRLPLGRLYFVWRAGTPLQDIWGQLLRRGTSTANANRMSAFLMYRHSSLTGRWFGLVCPIILQR